MSGDLVVAHNADALAQLDPAARELAVTQYLSHARDQLAVAVQMTGPAAVAALKAEIATAAEATKQLGLSRDIQQDAREMVRRAEYALGKAIRAGQERGEVCPPSRSVGRVAYGNPKPISIPKPKDFVSGDQERSEIYAMSDGVTAAEFDAAISDAKAEGMLSRANVVRKVRGVKSDGLTAVEKVQRIREMASAGHTSDQIARDVSATEEYVRRRAREFDIDIPADRVMARTRRLDHTKFVRVAVEQIATAIDGLDAFDPGQTDWSDQEDWVASLTDSMRALNRFVNKIRKGPNA